MPTAEVVRDQGAAGHQSAETELAILEAARNVLAEGGLEALSMRVVADRVGLSATALYRYFSGKDQLVRRVVETGYRRFGEYLQRAVDREAPGSMRRLLAIGEAYVRFAFENREYFRVLFNIQARIPREVEELPGGGGYHLLRQCVVDAIDAGAVRPANPDLVAHYLWICVHGLVTLTLACNLEPCAELQGRPSPHSAVDLFRSMEPLLVDGLSARLTPHVGPAEFVTDQSRTEE